MDEVLHRRQCYCVVCRNDGNGLKRVSKILNESRAVSGADRKQIRALFKETLKSKPTDGDRCDGN